MTLFDTRPLDDPLVGCIDPLGKVLVGDDIGRYIAPEPGDSGACLSCQGVLQVPGRLTAGATDHLRWASLRAGLLNAT